MSVQIVQVRCRDAIGFIESIHRVSIQGISNGYSIAHFFVEKQRRDMVVIVICATSMSPKFIQLPSQIRVGATILFDGIKNGHTVNRQTNSPPKQRLACIHWHICNRGFQWNLPCIIALIRLRQRHLLIPGCNPHHHAVIGKSVGLDIQKVIIPPDVQLICKMLECLRAHRGIALCTTRRSSPRLSKCRDKHQKVGKIHQTILI